MKLLATLLVSLIAISASAEVTKARFGSLRSSDTVVTDVQIEGVDTNTVRSIATEEAEKAVEPIGQRLDDTNDRISTVEASNSNTVAVVAEYVSFVDGSNVVISITNYISGTYNLEAAKLRMLELRDGEYREVYNSREEIRLHVTNESAIVKAELGNRLNDFESDMLEAMSFKADRDWGKYTSAGNEAPSNTTYITSPNTVFAGGMDYERVSVALGVISVLKNVGAPTYTQGDEGTFKFQDDGGTNYFGFAKTDSYTIGCNTDGIEVDSSGNLVTLTYNITMSGVPCIWYTPDLISSPWVQLNLSDGTAAEGAPVTISWEANPDPDTEVCYINVGQIGKGFFKATVEVAGSAKFLTNMPADMSGGVLCTDGQTIIKPVNNNGTITWEIAR